MASPRQISDFNNPSRAASPVQQLAQSEPTRRRRRIKGPPQRSIDRFWAKFTTKTPGKAFTILPDNLYAERRAASAPKGTVAGTNANDSYNEAVRICKAKVEKIIRECRRVNQKYRDSHFDIELDFTRSHSMIKYGTGRPSDCLMGLADQQCDLRPQAVKRVEDVFKKPRFYINKATSNDVRQGNDGNCWLMSALSTLTNKEGLIEKVCIARDEEVGVYGFVFYRDGEWFSEVIDDKLYLAKPDYDESLTEHESWQLERRKNPERDYRASMQTGSRALYFAQCSDENETWVPLLEKAYAKAHGDFKAIEGGFVGEGIEDLTGGVTTEFSSTDILNKDKFWTEELLNVNKSFLFGCGIAKGVDASSRGIIKGHAYSIMDAKEIDGRRLLRLRNPWGKTEWNGAWSDGSREWTPEWMKKLNHRFGDDGVFWISYQDLLTNYQHFDRTRLFGDEWTITQQWTSLSIPWSVDYHDTKFTITLAKKSPVVIVLSQLDDRYYRGLEGQFEFQLNFRLHHEDIYDDYVVRSLKSYHMRRSVSVEVDLEPGTYHALLKIIAKRDREMMTPEEIVRESCLSRREKLLRTGLSYDLAHAKGQFKNYEVEEKTRRKAERKAKRESERLRKEKKKQKRDDRSTGNTVASGGKKTPQSTPPDHIDGLGIINFPQNDITSVGGHVVQASQMPEQRRRSMSREQQRGPSIGRTDSLSLPGKEPGAETDPGFRGRGGYNATAVRSILSVQDLSGDGDGSPRGRVGSIATAVRHSSPGRDRTVDSEGGFTGRGGYNQPPNRPSSAKHISKSPGRIPHHPGERQVSNGTPREQAVAVGDDQSAQGLQGGFSGRGGYNIDPQERLPEESATKSTKSPEHGRSSKHHSAMANTAPITTAHATPRVQVNGADARSPAPALDIASADGEVSSESESDDSEDGRKEFKGEIEDDDDPWNAVCVVGLRVYSQDPQVKIQIVKPEWKSYQKKLDVDDASADATRLARKRSNSSIAPAGSQPAFTEASHQG